MTTTATYSQVEPTGFGLSPFGDPSNDKAQIEFGRGFGDPTTVHTEDESSVPNSISSDIQVLLLCQGTDGSTTITDEIGNVFSAVGNAEISTDEYLTGQSSLYIPDNTSRVSCPTSTRFAIGTGDFTLHLYVYFVSRINAGCGFINKYDAVVTNTGWAFYLLNGVTNKLTFYFYDGVGTTLNEQWTWNPSLDTWYHVAIVRKSGAMKAYVDGTALTRATTSAEAGDVPANVFDLCVGGFDNDTYNHEGYMSQIVFSNKAVWSTDFTRPSYIYTKYTEDNDD